MRHRRTWKRRVASRASFDSGHGRRARWADLDFYAAGPVPSSLPRRRIVLGRTVLPAFVWPRRYALRWQVLMWFGCLVLVLIDHA